MDFAKLETTLSVAVPEVYHRFFEAAEKFDLPLADLDYFTEAEQIIVAVKELREDWFGGAWNEPVIPLGRNDGCGNYFGILASNTEDDHCLTIAHDPLGFEDTMSASELLTADLCGLYMEKYRIATRKEINELVSGLVAVDGAALNKFVNKLMEFFKPVPKTRGLRRTWEY